MAKSATFTVTVVYEGIGSTTITETFDATSTFEAASIGTVDVADLLASASTINIPFGGVTSGAAAMFVRNRTGQELDVQINGATPAAYTLPSGGVQLIASASLAAGTPLTSCSLVTTATQAGLGYVDYFVVGS